MVAVVAAGALAGPGLTMHAEAASATLGATAEGGSLAGFAVTRSARATAAAAYHGAYGVQVSSTAAPGMVQWTPQNLAQGHRFAATRLWFKLVSRAPGESVDVLTINNGQGRDNFDLFITGDTRRFKWDVAAADWAESRTAVDYGRWYYLEVQVEFSGTSHAARVRIDGAEQAGVTSTGSDTTVAAARFGSGTNKTHTQHYDDLAIRVGAATVGWLPRPSAPPVASGGCLVPGYTLKGTVLAYGVATAYYFQYGATTGYGQRTATAYLPTDAASPAVQRTITRLTPDTAYHYRLVAQNGAGTSYGPDRVLHTAAGTC
jgi:hypothetical protein